eukprot:GAHX01004869.1.p2 GENE.GAHX01004869.1~~GAHX01004869.1.p2  ORF type:complete len:77 (+),score=7.01 GAHX01004869.1:75-305(+)
MVGEKNIHSSSGCAVMINTFCTDIGTLEEICKFLTKRTKLYNNSNNTMHEITAYSMRAYSCIKVQYKECIAIVIDS